MRGPRMAALGLAVLALLAGCGGDKSTGPSDANVGGAWRLSLSNMSGGGVTCNTLNPANITLSQSGSTFSGNYGPLTLRCTNGTTTSDGTFQGVVANGTVNLNSVAFDLDTQDLHHTGTVSGSSMSGSARWNIDIGGGTTVVLNGNWSAVR